MPRPCTVCAHPLRADIDRRLSLQVVNVKELARQLGLGRDALTRHRTKHLPDFLPAFTARASSLDLDEIQAEAQRLYLVTLDALAQAESGTLISLDEDGVEYRKVSSTAVARLIREARTGLGLLASLAADGPREPEARGNDALDQRILDALDKVAARALTAAPPVVDAEAVEEQAEVVETLARRGADGGGPTQDPGTWSGQAPPASRVAPVPLASASPPGGSGVKGTPAASLRPINPDLVEKAREVLIEARRRKLVTDNGLNASTSIEELRALGHDTDIR